MKKELQGLKKDSAADIHLESLGATLKKVPNYKTQSHDGKHGFWF